MSLIGSLLGLLFVPVKARKPPKEVENVAMMALAAEVKRLAFALDYWRESGAALMLENERLHAERDAERHSDPWQKGYAQAARDFSHQRVNAENAALQYANMQAYCTCVPSRAEALSKP